MCLALASITDNSGVSLFFMSDMSASAFGWSVPAVVIHQGIVGMVLLLLVLALVLIIVSLLLLLVTGLARGVVYFLILSLNLRSRSE